GTFVFQFYYLCPKPQSIFSISCLDRNDWLRLGTLSNKVRCSRLPTPYTKRRPPTPRSANELSAFFSNARSPSRSSQSCLLTDVLGGFLSDPNVGNISDSNAGIISDPKAR
ncbi:MAG: hypothetical protein SGCHY_004486, partial [Lobulomycetales sp.]